MAFVILALVATALFRLFSGALVNASAADDYTHAVLVAESVLAEAAATKPLVETTNTGAADDGRFAWTTQVTRYTPPGSSSAADPLTDTMQTRLFRITAEVTFAAPSGGTRSFTLATTRIGLKDAQ